MVLCLLRWLRRRQVEWTPKTGPPSKLLWLPRKGGTMAGKRKQHTAAFKAQVALAVLKGDRTVNEVASQFGVHPTLIHDWKKKLLAGAEDLFANGSKVAAVDAEAVQAQLYEQIGRLKMELEWVKKKAAGLG